MKLRLLLLAVAGFSLQGCYRAPVMPPPGYIYSNVSAPIDTDADETPITTKSGESSSISILGLIALGDASVSTAAEKGGLTTVDHVDYEYTNIIGVFQKFETKAYGE